MTPTAAGDGVAFGELRSRELGDAREEVLGWAYELYEDQLQTFRNRKSLEASHGIEAKKRPPTRAECLAKSVEIRRKRERDHSYWNELTSTNPTH